MKKLITFIIALLAFVFGTQVAYATPDQDLIVTLYEGMDLYDDANDDAEKAIYVLTEIGVLSKSERDPILHTYTYSSSATGRQLFNTFEDCVQLDPEVGSDDDIVHVLTEEDRNKLSNWYRQLMEPYYAIELHFPVKEDLEATLYNGLKYVENDDIHYAVLGLVVFNQLSSTYHSDTNMYEYSNVATNKTLFTATSDYVVTIASDVTASDDLYYVITDEDRDKLTELIHSSSSSLREELTNLYWFLMSYGTITLHFDVNLVREGTLGTQGTWRFENGVLTVDYIGAMPQDCTKETTDPEVAYRLKWIDFLSQIEEVVITGADVEIQPYFLYYEGDGPDGSHPDDLIKKVTLGSGVKSIGRSAFSLYSLKRVDCYSEKPPTAPTSNPVFWNKYVTNNVAWLHLVPSASIDYDNNVPWSRFSPRILRDLSPEDDPVGIVSPLGETEEGAWYSLDGRKLSGKPVQKGIYVNGGKKVLVK